MFTGIVAGVGEIKKVDKFKGHTRIQLESPFSLRGTKLGDSIALDGCCLTVTQLKGKRFSADVSPETLRVTTLGGLKKGSKVNLEMPLRMGDPLGGHLVQGHVDGVGKIHSNKLVKAKPNSYYLIQVTVPKQLSPYMIEKGSVTIDGISLTVNQVKGSKISLCIIPHTQEKTTLTVKRAGAKVNIEADILLKFVGKMMDPLINSLKKTKGTKGRK